VARSGLDVQSLVLVAAIFGILAISLDLMAGILGLYSLGQGGFMAMDTLTGRVLAMQGGFSYQSSVFNRATQALRQPGSSFKPFVYAAALDSGYSPATGSDCGSRSRTSGCRS